MRLLRLQINTPSGFRSLQNGFEIYFLRDFDYRWAKDFNPNILAGRNGSGKSNILEALANIFYHLDCMYNDYLPDGFLKDEDNEKGFDNTKCVVDAFELEYLIKVPYEWHKNWNSKLELEGNEEPLARIKVSKEVNAMPEFEWLNREEFTDEKDVLGKKQIQRLLPSYVIGYSSGENELLSLPFFKTRFLHYDEYKDKLIRQEQFGFPPKSEGRLVFLDKDYSQAILLSNFLMLDDKTLSHFKKEVGLEDIEEFRLIIRLDEDLFYHEDILRDLTESKKHPWDKNKYDRVSLVHNLKESIEKLKYCATTYNYWSEEKEDLTSEDAGREYLILDYKVTEVTKEAFRFHFANEAFNQPLQLFQLFQILLELNAYVVSEKDKSRVYQSKNIFINHDIYPNPLEDDRILRFKNLWVKKKGINKPLFTKEFSDGEHQFLHVLGLCLLFKNENALFLLDEPETHFNPDWKAKFISSVRNCLNSEDSKVIRDMLITTHSPYLISDSEAKYVNVFSKKDNNLEVICTRPEFQTLGASVSMITMNIFDRFDTIGDLANAEIEKFRIRFVAGENPQELIKEINYRIGESVEKTILINKILGNID